MAPGLFRRRRYRMIFLLFPLELSLGGQGLATSDPNYRTISARRISQHTLLFLRNNARMKSFCVVVIPITFEKKIGIMGASSFA